MGLFDDAVPGGNITKPLLIALGALLAGKMLSGSGKSEDAEAPQVPPAAPSPKADTGAGQAGGGLLEGGLGGLLERLAKNGQGEVADSWVKTEQENAPIQPQDLGKAIGDRMLAELARRTGIPQDQLLDQLSKALPGIVDKLTPDGRVPSGDQVAGHFRNNPW